MKVLICDPSPTGVKILSEELTNLDIEVTLAEDGLEFIRLIFSENPDLIISESDIPVLSGLHIARYIRTNARFKKTKYFLFLASLSGRTEILAEDTVDGIFKKDELGFHLLMEAVRRMIPEIGTEVKDEIDDFAPRPEISEIIESLDMEFDSLIFRDLLRGKLLGIAEFNSSLELTLQKLLHIIGSFTNFNIAIVLLKIEKSVVSYIDPGNLSTTDTEDFLSICLEDFYSLFDRKELNQGEKIILKKNEANPSPENHKVSSYYFLELQTPSGLLGSIHLGYYRNNYYTETFSHVFKEFMKEANLFIQNAISMKVITEKESNLNKIFQKFVPSDIINDLLTKKSTFSLLTGEKRNVAILFSDIRSFTTLSENNPPEAVVAFLNSYFDIMCKIITDNGER
ncbi:MAG: response regulator [Leptospiraceae bacterium]|nr:response regulator [Leptospiraceae bacterium]